MSLVARLQRSATINSIERVLAPIAHRITGESHLFLGFGRTNAVSYDLRIEMNDLKIDDDVGSGGGPTCSNACIIHSLWS